MNMSLESILQQAVIHHKAGESDKAEELYKKALAIKPDCADALHLLGLLKESGGQTAEGLALLRQACAQAADKALFHYDLGCALLKANQPAEAAVEFDQTLRHEKNHADAWFKRGIAFRLLGDFAGAAESFFNAAALEPNFFEAFVNLAAAQKELKEFAQATGNLRKALALKPDHAQAHNSLGLLYAQLGDREKAQESFRAALRCKNDYAEAFFNLGNLLREKGALNEAVKSYRLGLRYDPESVAALCNCGETLQVQGEIDAAEDCYRRALAIDPDCLLAQSNLLGCMNYNIRYWPQELFAAHRAWAQKHESKIALLPPAAIPESKPTLLTIGYVSPDFCKHPVSYFLEPILKNHDHGNFKIVCFAEVSKPDAATERFKSYADVWRDTVGFSDETVSQIVRQENVDILVDLAGHTGGNRLPVFMRRPAPVQITYLGYPNTTGCSTIDYRLTDAIASPEDETGWYSETLVRLAPLFCCFSPPGDAPAISAPPFEHNGFITFGSLHNLARLNDKVLDLWCRLLKEIPGSRLLVFRNTLLGKTKELLAERFARRGIAGDSLDIRDSFAGMEHHLSVYSRVDIALDTLPWSGHTTACEGLWMGVPIITLSGNRFAGRMVTSVLENLGLHELVAASEDEYIQRAKKLANDKSRLKILRNTLRTTMVNSALCDGKTFTKKLEETYVSLWDKKNSRQ
ncbi:MAG: tetratricopeptide repeat protein [Chitinivibrionales bacterium]|nr:tetratricopeptide repeat protein [Chitinivibrionales bacterium]